MSAKFRKFIFDLGDKFWLIPALMVSAGVLLAMLFVSIDRSGIISQKIIDGPWLYSGGGTGARTLLGAVVSSTIGVAGTVFSITIAALSLAAGQMGPRLLRNFTHDRGNQITLGVFLGTFSYALIVLRSVRTQNEGEFIPHFSLSVSIFLAFVCVGTLVYFVGHMASRINVDTVIDLVSDDARLAINRLMQQEPEPDIHYIGSFPRGTAVCAFCRGYLQHLDLERLAGWADEHNTSIRMLIRVGDFIFPGMAVAEISPAVQHADKAIGDAIAVGGQRVSADDLEFAIRQLVEVAVRALSPGINDPHTAISILDRLGAALCDAVPLHFQSGRYVRQGKTVLLAPAFDYAGLTDAMFHLIRQNAASSVSVLVHQIEVLTAVVGVERNPDRQRHLQRHAELALGDAERTITTPADLADIRSRFETFLTVQSKGSLAGYNGDQA